MRRFNYSNEKMAPYLTAQSVLSGKWSIIILKELHEETLRFNELHRRLEEITQSTLNKQLKYLEHEGLIVRTVYPEVPPRVEYSLTDIGRKFDIVLESIEIWGSEYVKFIQKRASQIKKDI